MRGIARFTLLAIVVALAGCLPCGPWQDAQFSLEGATVVSLACDGAETMEFLRDGAARGIYESNPVLGRHPSTTLIWSYLGAIAVTAIGGGRVVDRLWPRWGPRIMTAIDAGIVAVEIDSTIVNMHYGTGLCGVGGPIARSGT